MSDGRFPYAYAWTADGLTWCMEWVVSPEMELAMQRARQHLDALREAVGDFTFTPGEMRKTPQQIMDGPGRSSPLTQPDPKLMDEALKAAEAVIRELRHTDAPTGRIAYRALKAALPHIQTALSRSPSPERETPDD